MLNYIITPKNLGAHLLNVIIEVSPTGATLAAKLPKWIPGSYKIRDYSRFIQAFNATNEDGQALNWYKSDSDTWIIDTPTSDVITLCYDVYAYDLSVRGAYVDDTRLFFNHCCVALDVVEYTQQPRSITIERVEDWRIFTALPLIDGETQRYYADSYDHQIDCPVESASRYRHSEFTLNDVRHEVIFTGSVDDNDDIDGMTAHLKNICRVEMQLFGGTPLDQYLFMTYVEANQYGGLEHKNSVAQVVAPDMLMKKGQPMSNKMIDFMGLCSHEYFHLWNVKRLQPRDFQPYHLYREQHTEMLWFFEGFTSYYDELFLLRADVVNAVTFLKRQAENLSRVLAVPGRLIQPLAASSFDAWTKLYQADANSPNHMVSYYSKGAVFALYLDLFIRKQSGGEKSLDEVMRHLWKNFGEKGIGIVENDVFVACANLLPSQCHTALTEVFVHGLHGTRDFDFTSMLADFAVTYREQTLQTNHQANTSDSGLRLHDESKKIAFLHADSHAAAVGVSVDDQLLAINHQDSSLVDFPALLNLGKPGESLTLTLSRRGRVFEKTIKLTSPATSRVTFTLTEDNPLNQDWLAVWV